MDLSPHTLLGEGIRLCTAALRLRAQVAGEWQRERLGGFTAEFSRLCSATAVLLALRHVAAVCPSTAPPPPPQLPTGPIASSVAAFLPTAGCAGRQAAAAMWAVRRRLAPPCAPPPPAVGQPDPDAAQLAVRCVKELSAALLTDVPRLLSEAVVEQWVAAAAASDVAALNRCLAAAKKVNDGLGAIAGAEPFLWGGQYGTRPGDSAQHCIAADRLLSAAAAVRGLAARAASWRGGGEPLVEDGVAASDAALRTEEPFADSLCDALMMAVVCAPSTAGRPEAMMPLTAPADGGPAHARVVAGVSLQGGSRAQLKGYYLSCYAGCLSCPRVAVCCCPAAATAAAQQFSPVFAEWPPLLWESGKAAELHGVQERLQKENFAIPREVWDPYGDLPVRQQQGVPAGLRAPQLLSEWASKAQQYFAELREDVGAALQRRPAPPPTTSGPQPLWDGDGKWRAARAVMTTAFGFCAEFLSSTLNVLQARVDRFGFSDANLLPLLLVASDLQTVICENFDAPVLDLLTGGRPAPAETAPRIDLSVLAAVAGSVNGPRYPANARAMLPQLALLVGIAIDKARSDVEKSCARAGEAYCAKVLARKRPQKKRPRRKPEEADSDDEDDEEWTEVHSREVDTLVKRMLHPVLCVCSRLTLQAFHSVAPFAVGRLVAALSGAVATHYQLTGLSDGEFGPLKEAAVAGVPTLPKTHGPLWARVVAAGRRDLVGQLWADLQFVADYIDAAPHVRQEDRTGLRALAEWHAVARLEEVIAAAAPDS